MLKIGLERSEMVLKCAGWEAMCAAAAESAQPGRALVVAAASTARAPARACAVGAAATTRLPAQAVHYQPLPHTSPPTQRDASRMASRHACLKDHFWTQTAAMA